MLTSLDIRNFKRFDHVTVELGNPVVFIGPNNSGKTTALQALALWGIGVRRWLEKRGDKKAPEERPGVTINRRDLIAVPVPDANLLWRDLHVRDVDRVNGKQRTQNVRIDITVRGVDGNKEWMCGLEFDYANAESFYCRPLRTREGGSERMAVPGEVQDLRIAYLPPMSGLAANEDRLDPGAINVRLGEGRTAEVLRNLCYRIASSEDEQTQSRWPIIVDGIRRLFGDSLDEPVYVAERGEVRMTYRTPNGTQLDLSSSGRGLQQTLLLLAHLAANPRTVLLLDEPDAHLEILRQRQIYQLLTETAKAQGCRVIAASHSEVMLNEAADRDVVVAFLGMPHRIDDRGNQLLKSLREIGFDQFYQAEQTGWVLYTEGSTDREILRSFAAKLNHPALKWLERPFFHPIGNQLSKARNHFHGLREAKRNLVGFALVDKDAAPTQEGSSLVEYAWTRREIENYLCQPKTLEDYAAQFDGGGTQDALLADHRRDAMRRCIGDLVPPVALRDSSDRWWSDAKASDDFLDRLFEQFFQMIGLPNLMRKTDYHVLVQHVPEDQVPEEVNTVLDLIAEVAARAQPVPIDHGTA